jgi:hypothetical protein
MKAAREGSPGVPGSPRVKIRCSFSLNREESESPWAMRSGFFIVWKPCLITGERKSETGDVASAGLVASVLFGLAEIEQEYRRERQAAGIAVAKRQGVYRGRRKGTTKMPPKRAQVLRAMV